MVKKFIMEINKDEISGIDTNLLIKINHELHERIMNYKNKINKYYKNKLWDKYKKFSNEYELIFSTPINNNIALYNPLSRAFFKLWEILEDFNDEIFLNPRTENHDKINCLFLAESPGSFCEAMQKWRFLKGFKLDNYSGISLKSSSDKIPDWKSNNHFMKKINVLWGRDGTGNLYNLDNIEYLHDVLGRNSQEFITGDGGFDFSNDFNNQETISLRLIICEILSALLLQKEGGKFLLKIFDMFNPCTIKILQILKLFWKKIYVIKPLTSRPANSEKYILCSDFFFKDIILFNKWTKWLKIIIRNYDNINVEKVLNKILIDDSFLHDITIYNLYYCIKQIYHIQKTIFLINSRFNENSFLYSSNYQETNQRIVNKIKKNSKYQLFCPSCSDISNNFYLNLNIKHIKKSKKWCCKYNIPIKKSF